MQAGAILSAMEETGLKFPLQWHGRLISFAKEGDISPLVKDAFCAFMLDDGEISFANTSSSGTYVTWQLSATIPDILTLRGLFKALENLPGVRMLI